jgi:hypothetical protein
VVRGINEKEKEMSQESLDHVVSGVLFDFAGFLTTRKEKLICSSSSNAAPMVEALKEFMNLRGVDQKCDPMIHDWPMRLSKGKVRS